MTNSALTIFTLNILVIFFFLKLQVMVSAQIEAHKEDKFSKRGYPVVSEYQWSQTIDFNGNQQLFIHRIITVM